MQYGTAEHCASLTRLLADTVENPQADVSEVWLALEALRSAVAGHIGTPSAAMPPDVAEWHAHLPDAFPVGVN